MKKVHENFGMSLAGAETADEFRARVLLAAAQHEARAGLAHPRVSSVVTWFPNQPGIARVVVYVHE